jgi:imidazole glycerol-phosphate synthase subunit HisH
VIAILDYGIGNIKAFSNVYSRFKMPYKVVNTPNELNDVSKIILPGVGAFDKAVTSFQNSGLQEPILDMVLNKNVPLLGICIGMHLLANASEEGALDGLGLIAGKVRKLNTDRAKMPLPHMGWNSVNITKNSDPLFKNIDDQSEFYFLHSYYFETIARENVISTFEYCGDYPCGIRLGNIWGIQFHPEKSHHAGETLLKNFGEI